MTESQMREAVKRLIQGPVPLTADTTFKWGRYHSEWMIEVREPYKRIQFSELGRIHVLNACNAWSLELATDIVEIPGITGIDDAEDAAEEIVRWARLSAIQQCDECEAWKKRQEAARIENRRARMEKLVPHWGYVNGGNWMRHYATGVVKVVRVAYGRDRGDLQTYYETACGKELRLTLAHDPDKRVCPECDHFCRE